MSPGPLAVFWLWAAGLERPATAQTPAPSLEDSALYVGIPADDLPGPIVHQSEASGYSVGFRKGIVRVYIGRDEAATTTWMETMGVLIERHRPKPVTGLGDVALGVGTNIVLLRDDNLGIMVQLDGRATQVAQDLLSAAVRGPIPWPEAATLTGPAHGPWRVGAHEADHISWVGGRLADSDGHGLRFDRPPRAIISWDAWGRSTRADFGPNGSALAPVWDAATP